MQPSEQPATIALLKPRKVRGLVAVFDILGFSAMCKNSPDLSAIEHVIETVDLVPEAMPGLLSVSLGPGSRDRRRELVLRSGSWHVFSDTALLAFPDAETATPDLLILFFTQCAVFNRVMFDHGLPVRGSIRFGDFVLGNRCFAGKVIVEALEEIGKLDVACTVVSDDAVNLARRVLTNDTSAAGGIVLEMLFPLEVAWKTGVTTHPAFNWFQCRLCHRKNETGENPADIEKYIHECFTAHSKGMEEPAARKARNTAHLFRLFLNRSAESGRAHSVRLAAACSC